MENIFVEFLPPWVETGLQPAFYDKESGTVLQQTARMYDRVNMLVRMFNKLSKNTKEEIERFEQATNDEIERFERVTNEEIESFEHDVNETVDEYIEKFNDLHDYVEDYFDNLDVQEEINNKLDQMVIDGVLQAIIISYIQPRVSWTFNTVADMKADSNLVAGGYARTLGFHSLNDKGGGTYYITNTGTANEKDVIAVGDLYAVLVSPTEINPKQLGATGDGTTDDTAIFNYAINNYSVIKVSSGTYLVDFANINIANKTIEGENKSNCIIKQKNSGTPLFTIGARTKLNNLTIDAENNTNSESILVLASSYTGDYEITNLYIKCPNSIAINGDVTDGYRVGGTIRDIYIETPSIGISLAISQGVGRTNYFTRFFISNIMILQPTNCGIFTSCAGSNAQLSHANINNISVQLSVADTIGIVLSGNSMLNFSNIFTFLEGAGITFQNTYGLDFGLSEFSDTNLIRKTSINGGKIEGGFKNIENIGHYNLKDVEHIVGTKSLINNNSVTTSTIGEEKYESESLLKGGKFVEDFDPVGDTNYKASSNFSSYEVKEDVYGHKYIEVVTGTGGLIEYRYSIDYPETFNAKKYITMYAVFELANVTDSLPLPWTYAVSGEASGSRTNSYVPSTSYPKRFALTKTVNLADYLNGSSYRFGLSLPANTTIKIYKLDVVRGHQTCMNFINFD